MIMRSLPLLSLTILLGVAALTEHVEATESRELRFPPLKDGRLVLSVDTHTHSVFSDGHVWPTVRVWEANKDRLDAMAITEHLEYQPYREDIPHPDRNRAFELAVKENKQGRERTDLLLIPGAEITRKYAPGHVNALFIEDTNPLLTVKHRREENFDTARKALKAAKAQQGFMIWNHPAWPRDFPDGVIKISKEQQSLFDDGLIHGIEVANGEYFNDSSLQVALDHDLTIIGASDIHGLIDYDSRGISELVFGGFVPPKKVFAIRIVLNMRKNMHENLPRSICTWAFIHADPHWNDRLPLRLSLRNVCCRNRPACS